MLLDLFIQKGRSHFSQPLAELLGLAAPGPFFASQVNCPQSKCKVGQAGQAALCSPQLRHLHTNGSPHELALPLQV